LHFAPVQQNTRNSVSRYFLSRFRCTVADKDQAKMVQSRISKPSAHQLRAHPMAQNTHPKKENKFPLLAVKMKIYLHKL
jgi:hypothetical protein